MNVGKAELRLTSDLEDKLEQVGVTLAYEGNSIRRIVTVRSLLSDFSGHDMPARGLRPQWVKIARTLLILDDETVTAAQVRELRQQIGELRKAIRDHRVSNER